MFRFLLDKNFCAKLLFQFPLMDSQSFIACEITIGHVNLFRSLKYIYNDWDNKKLLVIATSFGLDIKGKVAQFHKFLNSSDQDRD